MKHFYENTYICGSLDFLPVAPQHILDEAVEIAMDSSRYNVNTAEAKYLNTNGTWFRKFTDLDGNQYNGRPNLRFEMSELSLAWIQQNITAHATGVYANTNHPHENDNGTTPIHTDHTRDWVLIYIVNKSNEDQHTRFWKEKNKSVVRPRDIFPNEFDSYECICDVVYETSKWYLMRTDVLHSQHNVLGKDRMSRLSLQVIVKGDPLSPGFFKEPVV